MFVIAAVNVIFAVFLAYKGLLIYEYIVFTVGVNLDQTTPVNNFSGRTNIQSAVSAHRN